MKTIWKRVYWLFFILSCGLVSCNNEGSDYPIIMLNGTWIWYQVNGSNLPTQKVCFDVIDKAEGFYFYGEDGLWNTQKCIYSISDEDEFISISESRKNVQYIIEFTNYLLRVKLPNGDVWVARKARENNTYRILGTWTADKQVVLASGQTASNYSITFNSNGTNEIRYFIGEESVVSQGRYELFGDLLVLINQDGNYENSFMSFGKRDKTFSLTKVSDSGEKTETNFSLKE